MHITVYGTTTKALRKCWGTFGKGRDCEDILARWSLGNQQAFNIPRHQEDKSAFWSLQRMQPTHISSPPGWLVLPKIHVLLWDVFRPQLICCSHNPDLKHTVTKRLFPFLIHTQTHTLPVVTNYSAPNESHVCLKIRLWLSFPTEKRLLTQRQVF